jgi:hypothetical protein
MKGHIRERSPGCWAIILDIPNPKTGKRRRKWHSFKGTKAAGAGGRFQAYRRASDCS